MARWGVRLLKEPQGNNGLGGFNRFSWEEFHALPRVLRDVLNYAPSNLGSGRAYDGLMAGSTVAAVLRQEVLLARRFQIEETLLSYGPDHPQAPGADSVA